MIIEKFSQYDSNSNNSTDQEFSTDFENAYKHNFSNSETINNNDQNDVNLDKNRYEMIPTKSRPTNIFVIEKKFGNKNLGRKKDKDKISDGDSKNIHDNTSTDNLLNKIQVHAINSIGDVANSILDFIKHKEDERFLNTSAKIKKKINKKEFKEIKEQKLYKILTIDISKKFRKIPKDHNETLYNNLKEKSKEDPIYEVLINFLDQDFLTFFKTVYHKKIRSINLHINGRDELIPLSDKVQLYEDKIKKFEDEEYKKLYKKCINDNYFDGKLVEFEMEKQI